MKISEMNTEELCLFVAKAAEPMSRISGDAEISKAVVAYFKTVGKGTPVLLAISRAVDLFVPKLLGEHKDDVFEIASALTGKSVNDIKKENGLAIIKEIKGCFDSDLVSFFTSADGSKAED